jgi:hypothetical protein
MAFSEFHFAMSENLSPLWEMSLLDFPLEKSRVFLAEILELEGKGGLLILFELGPCLLELRAPCVCLRDEAKELVIEFWFSSGKGKGI